MLSAYTEFTNYCGRLLINLDFYLKHVLYSYASCRNTGCKTFMPLFYGTVNQLLINLVPFIVMIFFTKTS